MAEREHLPPYAIQRQDPRWWKRSREIRAKAGWRCESCGSREKLTVHHGYYEPGQWLWEYPDDVLWCLCWPCHQQYQKVQSAIFRRVAKVHPADYGIVFSTLDQEVQYLRSRKYPTWEDALYAESQAEERRAYMDYYVQVTAAEGLGPSRATQFERAIRSEFPGIDIGIDVDDSETDLMWHVIGPDDDTVGRIERWLEDNRASYS